MDSKAWNQKYSLFNGLAKEKGEKGERVVKLKN